eukprot:TRINITY_DN66634_c7_g7_i3.p4 TRINITY_DN66634_c7_g7~~TRINITY_DN66634_c7_g7_i3.p4  ORF type:complete len:101 (+),score=1.70 TRINITY_DN66634_c7_g7_i3:1535-1837(+)
MGGFVFCEGFSASCRSSSLVVSVCVQWYTGYTTNWNITCTCSTCSIPTLVATCVHVARRSEVQWQLHGTSLPSSNNACNVMWSSSQSTVTFRFSSCATQL